MLTPYFRCKIVTDNMKEIIITCDKMKILMSSDDFGDARIVAWKNYTTKVFL